MYKVTHDLGCYLGDDKSKHDWLRERKLTWKKNINTVSETAGNYPQEIYAAVVCEIQSEWIFLHRVTWDTGDLFAGVEKMIRETFLTHIFFRNKKTLSPVIGALSSMLVKKSVLGLLNPVT